MTSIVTKRLTLHPYTESWVKQEHVDWLNNKSLMQYSDQRHHTHSLRSQYAYVRITDPNRILLIATDGTQDIGTISAYIDPYNRIANMGILLGPTHLGKGYGREMWTAVMEWLLDEGIHKIEAGCRADNAGMRHLATACGMRLEATVPGHFRVSSDHYEDMVLYGAFWRNKGVTLESPASVSVSGASDICNQGFDIVH